jgi:hypothetical protein
VSARIIELCDAAVDALVAAWPGGPTLPDAVTRVYGAEVVLSEDYESALIRGRQVYVFPATYSNKRILDRKSLLNQYAIAVLVVERYTDGAGKPLDEWMDERVEFVQDAILGTLGDIRLRLLGTLAIDPEQLGSVDVIYDRDLYMQRKTFWSQCSFVYQEASP